MGQQHISLFPWLKNSLTHWEYLSSICWFKCLKIETQDFDPMGFGWTWIQMTPVCSYQVNLRWIQTNPLVFWYHRRKFRSQTSDNMDRWKAEQGRGREKRKIRRKKSRRERVRRKKMQMRQTVGKSRNTVFFQWFVAPEGRKVGSLERRVRSQLRWEMKNCTPLWREAHLQVKMYKTPWSRSTFGSCDVEKAHAAVARSTCPNQNVQNTPRSDHFWKLRCRKSARRCGAKHVSKSKCTKHTILGPLLEVEMSKKCTPLWRESHFEVKMYKTHHSRTTFGSWDVEKVHGEARFQVKMYKTHHDRTTFGSCDVEKVHAVVARSTFPSQNVQNTPRSDHFWKLRCRKSARRCGAKHVSKSKCTKHTTFGPLLEVAMSKKCTPLWREAHFQVKMYKTHHSRTTFAGSDVVSKNDGRHGTFEEDLQRCIFRGRRGTKDMFMRDVRRSRRWFPERVAFWSIRCAGLLRWFCVTGAALRMTWHQSSVAGAVL